MGPMTTSVIASVTLIHAADAGDAEKAERSLQDGAYIETRHPILMVPDNHFMGRSPHKDPYIEEIVSDTMLRKKQREMGLTPLMRAAKEGHIAVVALLLERRANAAARDEDNMQPLHFACAAGSLECCALLLASKAHPQEQDDEGRTPIDLLAKDIWADRKAVAKWQVMFGTAADPDLRIAF